MTTYRRRQGHTTIVVYLTHTPSLFLWYSNHHTLFPYGRYNVNFHCNQPFACTCMHVCTCIDRPLCHCWRFDAPIHRPLTGIVCSCRHHSFLLSPFLLSCAVMSVILSYIFGFFHSNHCMGSQTTRDVKCGSMFLLGRA